MQSMHTPSPATSVPVEAENLPATQSMQALTPSRLYLLAMQSMHQRKLQRELCQVCVLELGHLRLQVDIPPAGVDGECGREQHLRAVRGVHPELS